MSKTGILIQELRFLDFKDDEIEKIIQIGEQEVIDTIIANFSLNGDSQKVDEYLNKFETNKDNIEQLNIYLHEIMVEQYGEDNIENEKENLLNEYLENIVKLMKQSREIRKKFTIEDPETLDAIKNAKNNPKVKEMISKINEDKDKKLY